MALWRPLPISPDGSRELCANPNPAMPALAVSGVDPGGVKAIGLAVAPEGTGELVAVHKLTIGHICPIVHRESDKKVRSIRRVVTDLKLSLDSTSDACWGFTPRRANAGADPSAKEFLRGRLWRTR
jgi:hypothetical protein